MPMNLFAQAKNTLLPFGKYKDRTLDEVASTDEGLLYLDWMMGLNDLSQDLESALRCYMQDPSIQKDLQKLLDQRR